MVTDEKFSTLHLESPTKKYFSTGEADFRVKNQDLTKGMRQENTTEPGRKDNTLMTYLSLFNPSKTQGRNEKNASETHA